MILLTNVLIIAGVTICMIDNAYVILFGRFIWGMASGAFTVFCPKYIAEMAPTEMKGSLGALPQLMCTFGIVVPAALGLVVPDDLKDNKSEYADTFLVQNYWRVVWGVPFVFAIIQVLFLLTTYRFDTPVALKQNGEWDRLHILLAKMYDKSQVQARLNQINVPKSDSTESLVKQPSMSETFCEPTIRRAAWVGCALSFFQQASGINAIVFYSASIFEGAGVSPYKGTFYVMSVNFLATLGSVGLLGKFGRRTLMIVSNFALAIILFVMGYATIEVNQAAN